MRVAPLSSRRHRSTKVAQEPVLWSHAATMRQRDPPLALQQWKFRLRGMELMRNLVASERTNSLALVRLVRSRRRVSTQS